MTKRDQAIALMADAGFHGDERARVRLIVESRVNRQTMNAAWERGVRSRGKVACYCQLCSKDKQL